MNFDKWARNLADEMGKKIKEEEVEKKLTSAGFYKGSDAYHIDVGGIVTIKGCAPNTITPDGTITHIVLGSKDLGGTKGSHEHPLFGKPNPNVRPEDISNGPKLKYTLSGPQAHLFNISGDGEITWKAGIAPGRYIVTVTTDHENGIIYACGGEVTISDVKGHFYD